MEIQGCISSLVSQFEPLVLTEGSVKFLGVGPILLSLLIGNFMKMAELILIDKALISVEEKDLLDSYVRK